MEDSPDQYDGKARGKTIGKIVNKTIQDHSNFH